MKPLIIVIWFSVVLAAFAAPASAESYQTDPAFRRGVEAYNARDYRKALQEWLPIAEQGIAVVQHNVALMYEKGYGLPKPDLVEAMRWYERAAAQGMPSSQNNLGLLYLQRDDPEDIRRGAKLLADSAKSGLPLGLYNFGLLYLDGKGVERDVEKAIRLFRQAASRDLPDAQFTLGQMYRMGVGVEMNEAEAKRWYRAAAAQNFPQAHRELALLDAGAPEQETQQAQTAEEASSQVEEAEETSAIAPETAELAPASGPSASDSAAAPQEEEVAPALAEPQQPEPLPKVELAAAQPAAAPAAPRSAAPQPEGLQLWLASLASPGKAEEQWSRLRADHGDLFNGMQMQVGEVARDSKTFFRMLAGPVPNREEGRAICRRLQERAPEAWCKVVATP